MNYKDHLERLGLKERFICGCGCKKKHLTSEDYQVLINDPLYQEDQKKQDEEYRSQKKDGFNKMLEEVYRIEIDRKEAPYKTELKIILEDYRQEPTILNEIKILSFVDELVELFKEFYIPKL